MTYSLIPSNRCRISDLRTVHPLPDEGLPTQYLLTSDHPFPDAGLPNSFNDVYLSPQGIGEETSIKNPLDKLPLEQFLDISSYLDIKDIYTAMKVSRQWNNFFRSKLVWKFVAKKYEAKKEWLSKLENFLLKYFSSTPLIGNKIYQAFSQDYREVVRRKIERDIQQINETWPYVFLDICGGAKNIYKIPKIPLEKRQISTVPISRCDQTLTFRIKNHSTGKITNETLLFFQRGYSINNFWHGINDSYLVCSQGKNSQIYTRGFQCLGAWNKIIYGPLEHLSRLLRGDIVGKSKTATLQDILPYGWKEDSEKNLSLTNECSREVSENGTRD